MKIVSHQMHRPIGRRVHDYPQQRKQAETAA